ncbi:hypothetical protein Clacol_001432 [Clathrus columnatus]|uniref:RRM domain-containing protein n=1 Tax=Clathrus columnatus TaxID=1419009 RepID=A0AAV4ZY97_9AGAM|nr:hypothetical protein Clacol_001432 [Clathrus columnatus]
MWINQSFSNYFQHLARDVIEVQLPSAATNPALAAESKHRGFAFVTFTQAMDAQDAIDNMDMNEFRGRILKVNIAKPQKVPLQGLGNRPIWESEDWLQTYGQHPKDRTNVRAKSGKGTDEDDENDNKE